MDESMPGFEPILTCSELGPGNVKLVKHGKKRLVVVHSTGGEFHALDDQCPHEGYPLSKGDLAGDVLTCCYHNFKFDVRSGACLKGDEAVTRYPTRIRDGVLEADLTDPDPSEAISATYQSLEQALFHRRVGQASRDVVRLLRLGETPRTLALFAAQYDAEVAEYGSAHALAVATDVLHWIESDETADIELALMQAFEFLAEVHVRLPRRKPASAATPPQDAFSEDALLRLVEEEELEAAEAYLRGWLAAGATREQCYDAFIRMCAAHFLGFGHGLIYTVKAFELLDENRWADAAALLPGLIVSHIQQTREDLLPEWKWYRERCASLSEAQHQSQRSVPFDAARYRETVLSGTREDVFDETLNALKGAASPMDIADELIVSASHRLLAFNLDLEFEDGYQEGWLDVSHTLTFASALREALELPWLRTRDARALTLQAARFVHHAGPLVGEADPWLHAASQDRESDGTIATLVETRNPHQALAFVRQRLSSSPDKALRQEMLALAARDSRTRPIVIAHLIKTGRVAFDEAERLYARGHEEWRLPILAFTRLMASPIRERWVSRLTGEAKRLIDDGKVPRTLT